MGIEQDLAGHTPDRETALTIGVFDGVHRGHRHLIARVREVAGRTDRLTGVITFSNHPASVLETDFIGRYLTTVERRLSLVRGLGVDFVIPVSFDIELSRLEARQFVVLLQDRLMMKDLVVGPDFAMGHRRQGDVETLTSLGREMGFAVHVVEPLADGQGQPIGSTAVRDALARGNVATVADLLDRHFEMEGVVVAGAGRGASLGFPTANLEVPPDLATPGDGIYATWAHIGPGRYMAATSVGRRPTFDDGQHTVEAFLLDFEGDLYGQPVRLEFLRRLRDELKFDSVEALQDQVERDVADTRAILEGAPAKPEAGRPH